MTVIQSRHPVNHSRHEGRTDRLDIQGLRMIAVLTVLVNHLWGWPKGGFVGVDVFFVISGFLITGGLLRTFDKTGRISFTTFYIRRFKRIVPAATLVLILTCVVAAWAFFPSRAASTRIDALWGFLFVSNWRFAIDGTDYFTAGGPISPLRHYWSLSVEEQFYFVWPAVILIIGLIALRRTSTAKHGRTGAALVMGLVVVASFAWSVYETSHASTWAYFNTFSRVWELGAGALLAICAGAIAPRLPDWTRTSMSYLGLALIAAAVFVVPETPGFPAPWAALPVVGAGLVIAAGIGREPNHLEVLTNPVSRYVGDISYSLYLWHWPVIVLLAAVMDKSADYYIAALGLSFAGAMASFHLVENPIRYGSWAKFRRWMNGRERDGLKKSTQYGAVAAGALLLVGLFAYATRPVATSDAPPLAAVAATPDEQVDPVFTTGTLTVALQKQIATAAGATDWPGLSPSMDAAISGPQAPRDISKCGMAVRIDPASCTWGNPKAPKTMMILGDSVGMTYVQLLKNFAENSGGQWKVRTEAMFGCAFVGIEKRDASDDIGKACPGHKVDAIAAVNKVRPNVVFIANHYDTTENSDWTAGMTRLTSQFASNVGKIVFLSAPPDDLNPADCYTRASKPADCLGRVTSTWNKRASNEKYIAQSVNGLFIDARPWFCTVDGYCPSFVGTTPTKSDKIHMTPQYGAKISPAFAEALRKAGL